MILTMALISAIGILFILFKFGNIRKLLAFDIEIDIGSTALLAYLYYGTMGGMAIAAVGGVIVSTILWITKLAIGHEKLTVKGWKRGPSGYLNGGNYGKFSKY